MMDQHGNLYFWLPIVAPIIGGLIGGGLFILLIDRYLPKDEEFTPTPPVSEPRANT